MSKFATPARFGDEATGQGGSWWSPPLTLEDHLPAYTARAELIAATYTAVPRNVADPASVADKVLVAGCGYGFLVLELWRLGFNAYGCDGIWPVDIGKGKIPGVGTRLITGDCTSAADMAAVKQAAGVARNRRFALVVTEGLLNVADSVAEVGLMLPALRGIGATVGHFITCYDPDDRDAGLPAAINDALYRTPAQWRATVGTGERIWDINGGDRVVP